MTLGKKESEKELEDYNNTTAAFYFVGSLSSWMLQLVVYLTFVLFVTFSVVTFADKEVEKTDPKNPLIVSHKAVTVVQDDIPLDDINLANKQRLFDWASAANGAYGTSDCQNHAITANIPLETISIYSMGLSYFHASCTFEVNFIRPVYIDTVVYRAYDNNIVSHFFTRFESSVDGLTWQEIIPPNTSRSPVFQEVFPARLAKMIRIQGFSRVTEDESTQTSTTDKLAITKLQAFYANQQLTNY